MMARPSARYLSCRATRSASPPCRTAPGGPKIQHHHLAVKVRGVDRHTVRIRQPPGRRRGGGTEAPVEPKLHIPGSSAIAIHGDLVSLVGYSIKDHLARVDAGAAILVVIAGDVRQRRDRTCRYRPRGRVSKLLPAVLIVTVPMSGAFHDHQTEAPPVLPAWLGSPVSFVAADIAAGDDDIRAGDDNAVGEHIVRRLSLAE